LKGSESRAKLVLLTLARQLKKRRAKKAQEKMTKCGRKGLPFPSAKAAKAVHLEITGEASPKE